MTAVDSTTQPLHNVASNPGTSRGLILGIETSCDETSAAVVERGGHTLSNIVASQVAIHHRYGGVVPELASREHLRNIVPVVRAALGEANISLQDLDAIAVTSGPGLAGALLVGIVYAKALAFALGKPLIAVNHLEGHIHAVLLEQRELVRASGASEMLTPSRQVLALVVSGGHSHLYLCRQQIGPNEHLMWSYRNIGRTLDDAAGEAFDKVAKLLGLGYPGGPWIDALAAHGNATAVPFAFSRIKEKAHLRGTKASNASLAANSPDRRFLFSFSGIKTAVLRYVETHNLKPSIAARKQALASIANPQPEDALPYLDPETRDLIASFQHAVVGDLKNKTFLAAETFGVDRVLVSGGVAANRELRVRFTAEAADRGIAIAFPSLALSTDNAAMIAAAAWPRLVAEDFAPADLSADPSLALGT